MKFVSWSVESCGFSQTMLAIVSVHKYWQIEKQTSEAAHTSSSRCPLCWACGYSWNYRCVHGVCYPFDCRLPMDTAKMHAASCSDALGWLSYSLQAAYLVVHWNVKRLLDIYLPPWYLFWTVFLNTAPWENLSLPSIWYILFVLSWCA
jgi:hypothetical protein